MPMKNLKTANISHDVENAAAPLKTNKMKSAAKYVNFLPRTSANCPDTNPPNKSPPIWIVVIVDAIQSFSQTRSHCNINKMYVSN